MQKKLVSLILFTLLFITCHYQLTLGDDMCIYHQEHNTDCGYLQECLHQHDESCYENILICDDEDHHHTNDCYESNLNCLHIHDASCKLAGAQDSLCNHLCSFCDKDLIIKGQLEENNNNINVDLEMIGKKSDDSVYFYIVLKKNYFDFIDLDRVDGKYVVEDHNHQLLVLEPFYLSNDDDHVYLKFQIEYNNKTEFEIPLQLNDEKNIDVTLSRASSFDESNQKEIDHITLKNDIIKKAISFFTSSQIKQVTGTNFSQYIDNIELKTYQNGKFEDVVNGQIKDGDNVDLTIHFSMPEGIVTSQNKTIYYQLPNEIKPLKAMSGIVYDGGVPKGTYEIGEDGLITITFNDEYANGEPIAGYIRFTGVASLEEGNDSSQKVVIGETEFTINPNIDQSKYDIAVKKEATKQDNKMDYKVVVSSKQGTQTNVEISDILEGGQTYDQDSFQLVDSHNQVIDLKSYITFNEDNTSFSISQLPQLKENESYTLTYSTHIDSSQKELDGQQIIKNKVSASSGNKTDIDETTTQISSTKIKKTGTSTRGEGYIHWKIELNDVENGDIVKEILPEGLSWEDLRATITPAYNQTNEIVFTKNDDGSYQFEFKEGIYNPTDYVIEFDTKVTKPGDFNQSTTFTNIAKLETKEDEYENSSTITYYNDKAIDKNLLKQVNEDVNGAYYQWDVLLTTPNIGEYHYVYSDTLSSSQTNDIIHYYDYTFFDTLKIKDEKGNEIPSQCYEITFYDQDGNRVDDLTNHTAVTYKIDFINEKLNEMRINPTKINISYQSYASYDLKPGQYVSFHNKGEVSVDPDPSKDGDEKKYEDSIWNDYRKEAAIEKIANGSTNITTEGGFYKWKTTLNVPSLANTSRYEYTDILSNDNHIIRNKEEFMDSFVIKDEKGNMIDSSCYQIIFLDNDENEASDNDIIKGFKIIFDSDQLNQSDLIPSKIIIDYQTYGKYNMLPGDSSTYTNIGKITIDDQTYEDSAYNWYTKEPGLSKSYTSIENSHNKGADYWWKSELTYPNIDDLTSYYYKDMLSASLDKCDHYFLLNDLDLKIVDENNEDILDKYYHISYYDKDGKSLNDIQGDTKIYGYQIDFDCKQFNQLEKKPVKIMITYRSHATYHVLPGESVNYINEAKVSINNEKDYKDSAQVQYKKDDAIKKTSGNEIESSREGAYYSWNVVLTCPDMNELDSYEYVDELSSDSSSINHYIVKDKFDLKIVDQNNHIIDSSYYDLVFLNENNQEVSDDELITKFKICFHVDQESSIKELDLVKLNISYQTYAKYDMNAGETVSYMNKGQITINQTPYESIVTKPHLKEKIIKKMNGYGNVEIKEPGYDWYTYQGKRKIFIPDFSEETITVDRDNSDMLYYAIMLKADENNKDIDITDYLPEGTELIIDGDYAPYLGFYQGKWNFNSFASEINGKNITLDDFFSYQYDKEKNIISFHFDKGVNEFYSKYNSSKEKYITIVYALKITSPYSNIEMTKHYTNTIEMNDEKESSTQKVYESGKIIDKRGSQDNSKIHYQLIVNPAGRDLLEESDRILLIDELQQSNKFDYISFVPSSLKVYRYDIETQEKGEPLDTSLYKYTYENATYKLTVELPDRIACWVEYDYMLSTEYVDTVLLTNKARIEGIENSKTESNTNFDRVESSAEVTKKRFNIYKVDSSDYAITLSDAMFELYVHDGLDTSEWTLISNQLKTDSDGKLEFSTMEKDLDAYLETNKLYKLKEIKAPTGYKVNPDYASTYFIIKEGDINLFDNNGKYHSSLLEQLGIKKENIKILNPNGGNYYVQNDYANLDVKKVWIDYNGQTIDPIKDKIKLHLYRSRLYYKDVYPSSSHKLTINIYQQKTDETILLGTIEKQIKDDGFVKLTGSGDYIVKDEKSQEVAEYSSWLNYDIKNIKEDKIITITIIGDYEITNINNSVIVSPSNWPADDILTPDKVADYEEGELLETVELSSLNQWSYSWDSDYLQSLKDYDPNEEYYYYVVEDETFDGWSVSYDRSFIQSGTIVVTNKKDEVPIVFPEVGGHGYLPYLIVGLSMASLGLLLINKKSTKRKVGDN